MDHIVLYIQIINKILEYFQNYYLIIVNYLGNGHVNLEKNRIMIQQQER